MKALKLFPLLFLFSLCAFAQNTGIYPLVTASGTDTYTATVTPAFTAYTTGQRFNIKFTNANTGAATININSKGAKSIVKNGSTALSAGDIAAGQVMLLVYDGTNMQIVGPSGGPFVPQSRTLTINGTAYDLSENRSWTIVGGAGGGAEVLVDDYGAVGDGVTDDTDAINDAFTAAGANSIVRFSPNKTYLHSNQLTWAQGMTLIGYGATLKRAAETKTTLTSVAANGGTSFTVTSAAGLEIGDFLIILDGTGTYAGKGDAESSNTLTISNISGNTITVSTAITLPTSGNLNASGQFPIGSVVLKVFNTLGGFNGDNQVSNKIYGLTFDGNRSNNNSFYGWTANRVIFGMGRGSVVQHCIFKDIGNECILISNDCVVSENLFYNLNGSAIHISKSAISGGDLQTYGKNRIINNIMIDVMEQAAANGRAAAITNSANSVKTYIEGNQIDGCGAAVYGNASVSSTAPSMETYIYNNVCRNTKGVIKQTDGTAVNANHIIIGNIFDTCEWLLFEGNSFIREGYGSDKIVISGNTFTDTVFLLEECSNVSISGNTFTNTEGHVYVVPGDFSSGATGIINLTNCVNVTINGNAFEDKSTTLNTRCKAAVICQVLGSTSIIKQNSAAGTATDYAYARNIKVTNNQLINFANGISDITTETISGFTPDVFQRIFSFIGFDFSGNTIVMRNNSDARWGILAGPGVHVDNNKIYGGANTLAGIRAIGANDGSGSAYTGTIRNNINGAIVTNNKIYGCNPSMLIGNTASATRGQNDYNCQVQYNFITKALTDNTGGTSTVSNNVTLTIDESPIIQRPRQNPEYYP
jgi:hypothetical protein